MHNVFCFCIAVLCSSLAARVRSVFALATKDGQCEKLIEYKKLSKKAKRELDLKKRKTCGEINPVTRKSENPKAYKRYKLKAQLKKDFL